MPKWQRDVSAGNEGEERGPARDAMKPDDDGDAIAPSYLRQQAQRCVRLARQCPHQPTSHELEVLGVELMEKAAELDELMGLIAASKTTNAGGQ